MSNTKQNRFDFWSLIAGIVFIVAAILVFVWPFKAFKALIVIIGIVALCLGLYHLLLNGQWAKYTDQSKYLVIFNGCVDIIIGLLFLFSGSFDFYVIALIFAVWFIVDSVLDIKDSMQKQQSEPKTYFWLLIIAGILGIIIGIVLLFTPYLTDRVALIFIGIYFVIEGLKFIVHAF